VADLTGKFIFALLPGNFDIRSIFQQKGFRSLVFSL
jgi:hypothetical protein